MKDPAFVVGGAVRDRLLKRPVLDFDVVVEKNPSSLAEKVAQALKGSAFVLDKDRGVHRVSFDSRFQVDFVKREGSNFEQDLDRRDYTINALSIPLKSWFSSSWQKKIIDRHQGLKDLKKKKIRAISKTMLKEDPLRLMRAFRIGAELQFTLDPTTLKQIGKSKNLIKRSAPERIREEWLKMFSADISYPYLVQMEKCGVLDVLLPECRILRKTAPQYYGKGGVLKHTLDSVYFLEDVIQKRKSWFPKSHKKIEAYLNESFGGHPRAAHLKWATLLHDLGKPATAKKIKGRLRFFEHEHVGADHVLKMGPRFRWSSDETSRYARLVRNHMRPGNLATHETVSDKAIHRFFRDLGDDAIGMLLVSLGDHITYLTAKERKRRNSPHELVTMLMINRYYQNRKKVLPPRLITGHDIMKAFQLPPSKLIGDLLKDIQDAQSEGKVKTKEEGLRFVKERLYYKYAQTQ